MNRTFIIRLDGDGFRYEFGFPPTDLATARGRAFRLATLVPAVAVSPVWAGGRVSVHDAVSGRLVAVVKLRDRKAVRA